MSSGFEWNEHNSSYENPENIAYQMSVSDDMIKFVLDLPLSHDPGEFYRYNSGGTTLLSGIIRNSTGQTTGEFANENLFEKIGIEEWKWWKGSDGLEITGWGLLLKPRDMLKFGELYINNGYKNGEQIISTEWIEQSTTPQIQANGYKDYGYQWWVYREIMNGFVNGNHYYMAQGYGGQFIWVIPHSEMVVVSTAGNYGSSLQSEAMLWEYLVPSMN